MKRSVKIKYTSMQTRAPIGTAILWWLLLDRLGAPGWAYGVMWSVIAILAVAFIASFFTETLRDVPGFGARD